MTAVPAAEWTLESVVGRDEFGVAQAVGEERRTERVVRERLQDLERQMRWCEVEMIELLDRAERERFVPARWASVGAGLGRGDGALVRCRVA